MSVQLYCGDSREILPTLGSVDAIITDAPYDNQPPITLLENVCSGNILMFCNPKNQPFIADEYLFWIKTPSTKNYKRHCGNFVEMILVRRQGTTFNPLHWSQMTGVYDDRLIYPNEHPHEKPLSLLERLIRIYTNPGDTVADFYMGSGGVGVACVQMGRNFIGIEISEEYFKIAEKKIAEAQMQPLMI